MRASASVVSDPPVAGAQHDLTIALDIEAPLTPADTVEWQLPHSWTERYGGPSYTKPLQTTDPSESHYVTVSGSGGEFALEVLERQWPDTEMETRHGRQIVATLTEGEVPAGTSVELELRHTTAPVVAGTEPVRIRVAGHRPDTDLTLETRPTAPDRHRVIVPSGVEPGEPFDVRIVSLDRFDNVTEAEYDGERLETIDGPVARDLSFTGRTTTTVSLSEAGVYWFRFDGTVSNPVRVAENADGPYWGDIHVHTGLSHDGQGNEPYAYAREVSGLDFAATTEHVETLSKAGNDVSLERTARANDPGSFVTIPAYEITLPDEYRSAHYNFYFRSERAYRDRIERTDSLERTETSRTDVALVTGDGSTEHSSPSELAIVPHHTGIGFGQCDPADLAATDLAPVLEIYSHHGQSERYDPQHALAYEFNRFRRPERRSNRSVPGNYYAADFWTRGHRMGVICSSDEHTGQPGRSNSGCTAVFADDLSRSGLFEAIEDRACYGTTGERILLEFTLGDARMGERITASVGETLEARLAVRGTDALIDVEVLRYRDGEDGFVPVVSETPYPSPEAVDERRPEAMTSISEFDVDVSGSGCYYARVTQCPVEWPAMAWTSPIWVDVPDE